MQQTKTYKLNLIETSDAFSPLPLNENAEKTEAALDALHTADAALDGAVARCREENCLVKLGGPLVAQTEGEELDFDLSGIGLSQFSALLLVGGKPRGATTIRFNDDDALSYTVHAACAYPCAGFTLLADSGNGYIVASAFYTLYDQNFQQGKTLKCSMTEVKKLTVYHANSPGAHFSLYGIRA